MTPEASDEGVLRDLRASGAAPALPAALAASVLAFLSLTAGALVPVVDGGERGLATGPVVLVVLAVLPLALAAAFALRGGTVSAAGVLAGAAALAPGRAVLDLQLAADPSRASRPELYLPSDLYAHSAALGLWLLVAGHVLTAVAGVLALRSRAGAAGEVAAGDAGDPGRRLAVAVSAAVVAGIGLVMQPFTSTEVYLLAQNAFEGPVVAMAGYLLVAAALPVTAAIAVSSGDSDLMRGGLLGAAAGGAAVAVPAVVAALGIGTVGLAAGPVVALVGLAVLVVAALVRIPAADVPDTGEAEMRLPGSVRLRAGAGAAALAAGACAVIGAVTPQLETQGPIAAPESPARWSLLAAGVVVGVLGAAMFVPRIAVLVRPVLSVAWVAVLVAGTAVLDTAVIATGSAGGVASSGPGVVWTWVAMVAAAVAACSSVVAGAVERDDLDDAGLDDADDGSADDGSGVRMSAVLLAALAVAGVLTVVGFGMPVFTAPDYVPAGLWARFGTPSWGLLAGAAVTVGALVLAARSRQAPAVGLLCGVGAVLALHAASFPLSRGEIAGVSAGPGFWFAFAAVIAVLVAAMAAALVRPVREDADAQGGRRKR
ncbi:hypothetical protein FB384_000949 [Prauserella sediminis]|uniref:Uncharacterized protein n=1 Tax=Prauserella sediminis TaxID=577680 RepID=A0A839XQ44_9PSEU|nr:hypothetical protein [Prauserella sediminis]MBB3662045.1 hypothetical protein [Prauserella sediminis]